MVMVQPGMNADDTFARTLQQDDSVETLWSDEMLCGVDVWVEKTWIKEEPRPRCILASPVLYMQGHVYRIRGALLDQGPIELVYPLNSEIDDDAPNSSLDVSTSVGSLPILAAQGPEVLFRYEFTPAEKVRLVEQGIFEPDFEIPSILEQNMLETMPITCRFMTVMPTKVPEGVTPMPFVFAEIPQRSCIDTSANDCGYRLADYFKKSVVMEKFMDVLIPTPEPELVEQLAQESVDDDVLADYMNEDIKADKERMRAEREAQAKSYGKGKVLAERAEDADERTVDEDAVPEDNEKRMADARTDDATWGDAELDSLAVDRIADAFAKGESPDVIANEFKQIDDDAEDKSRARKQRLLRQRGILESEERADNQMGPEVEL